MVSLLPFRALRPDQDRAAAIASVPYDVISENEARAAVAANPDSFLRVIRPEVDLPADATPEARYDKAAENLERLVQSGALREDAAPALYVYRVGKQTGVAALCSTAEYESGRIKRHEWTRPDKENDRTRLLERLGAHVGPVFLTHRDDDTVAAAVGDVVARDPIIDFTASDGVRHTIWCAPDSAAIQRAFAPLDLYIADGHHRAASAARVDAAFLGVMFPAGETGVLAYNRVLRDLHGLDAAAVRQRLGLRATDEKRPPRQGEVRVYLAGSWYALSLAGNELDCALLQDQVLTPVFGIQDVRTDARIDFVGGSRGPEELERLVDSGAMAIAFSMYPTGVNEVIAVADRGEVMPPKSTWFEPKLRSGLLVARTIRPRAPTPDAAT